MSFDEFVHVLRPAGGEPEGAIVLFHGRGAHEHDLFPLIDIMDPQARLVGATVRGPLQLPPGGYHWYVSGRVGYPEPESFQATYSALGEWLEAFSGETGVPMSRTFLGGFSQGAVMTYAMGLGKGRPRPAGLLPFSGFIPQVEGFELDLDRAKGLPVAIGHGFLDDVIPVEYGLQARDRLTKAGAAVTYREAPMGHGIEPDFLISLQDWIVEAAKAGL